MYDADHIYSLDIETDTSPLTEQEIADGYTARGLDPRITPITQVSLVTAVQEYVFEGDECAILLELEQTLRALEPGLITTWHGSFFDLPFIHDRAQRYAGYLGPFGLMLLAQPGLTPKYAPTPGHSGGYTGLWNLHRDDAGFHTHLDIAFSYKAYAASFGVHPEGHEKAGKPVLEWALKPVCRSLGIPMIELDRTRMHTYSADEVRDYVLSDTRGTRTAALRQLGL